MPQNPHTFHHPQKDRLLTQWELSDCRCICVSCSFSKTFKLQTSESIRQPAGNTLGKTSATLVFDFTMLLPRTLKRGISQSSLSNGDNDIIFTNYITTRSKGHTVTAGGGIRLIIEGLCIVNLSDQPLNLGLMFCSREAFFLHLGFHPLQDSN